MSLLKRYCTFFCGILFMSIGICLIIASHLGSSPISSVPYVLSRCTPLSLGMHTLWINIVLIIAQILILRRHFEYIQLLQAPVTIMFSFLLDIVMPLAAHVPVSGYFSEIAVLLIGCCVLAFGVTLEVVANVIMLPGEGIVNAVATNWKLNFGYTKIANDTSLVLLAAAISYFGLGEIVGIREGTLISAFLVGYIVNFLMKHISYTDAKGRLQLKNPFGGKKSADAKMIPQEDM